MKKKRTERALGNTLIKEQVSDERVLPDEAQRILDEDSEQQRIKLAEIKNKIASGRYSIPSTEIAKAIVNHISSDSDSQDDEESEDNSEA